MSFYSKKIPVLHFFTGTHEDYHRATDTWEKLNIEGMAKISDLVLVTTLEIANRKEPIRFVSLPSRPSGSVGTPRGVSVYLGTIPDYGVVATGVRLAGVSSGSPAAQAGLREGDVIVRLGDKAIQNIEDLTDALQAHKSGDQVSVVVLRAGAPITLKATLSSRG
jgi:predicted metalloprotease with PDZ domain